MSHYPPLGMMDTKVSLTAADLAQFAAHYWPHEPRVERQRWIFGEVCAFAGLASTILNLARFVAMHLVAMAYQVEGPVRGPSLCEMCESVVTGGPDPHRGVTMGWFFEDHPHVGRILSHAGEVDGHSAMLWLAPQVETAIIVLVNVGGSSAPWLTHEIRTVVVGDLP
jgi:serine-type D-Ala-D-Ala carboxypeptidase/endopeptidase